MSLAKLLDLKGRTALVTGGSRGLGLQMAEVLGELGAKVAISARKAAELEEAKAHLEGLGVETVGVERYEGGFRAGRRNGYGQVTGPDGKVRSGRWADGKVLESTP